MLLAASSELGTANKQLRAVLAHTEQCSLWFKIRKRSLGLMDEGPRAGGGGMAFLLLDDSGIRRGGVPKALPSLRVFWSFGCHRTQLESQGCWLRWRRPESASWPRAFAPHSKVAFVFHEGEGTPSVSSLLIPSPSANAVTGSTLCPQGAHSLIGGKRW